MGIDRRLLVNVDWVLLGVTLLLTGLGVLTILSAAHSGHGSGLYLKQLYLVGLGLPCLLVSLLVDYRRLADRAVPLYLLAVGALVYVLFFGPRIAATRRWIALGSFHGSLQLQPSELVKLVAALFVAKVFAESRSETLGLRDVLGPGAAVGLLSLLVASAPDPATPCVCALTVLALSLLLLLRRLEPAQLARDRVGAFLAAGIAATFAFQVVYNVAMVAGLLPVKGLPLPLMSYGGSSILSSLLAVGLILNVRMRRFAN